MDEQLIGAGIMDGRIIGGVVAGAAGIGVGLGAFSMLRSDKLQQDQLARAEWNAWKAPLDEQFPSTSQPGELAHRPLSSAADELRFEQFLEHHPAPRWVVTEHKNLRQVSIDPFEPQGSSVLRRPGVLASAGVLGGGLGVAFAGQTLAAKASSPLLKTLGTSAAIAGGLAAGTVIASSFFLPSSEIHAEIESTEWHVPSKWYH